MKNNLKQLVKENYTKVVQQDKCCESSCCSSTDAGNFSDNYLNLNGYVPEADYGLGCGLPTEVAGIKKGDTVLDLGSGAGNDVFIASRIVGDSGKVIGVDFTQAMLDKANQNKQKLAVTNVEFIYGDIENIPVIDSSVDVVISNCVMNLVPDKRKAYAEVFRVLKKGAHFSISDIVSKGILPKEILNAAGLYATCIAGAVELNDYLEIIRNCGFSNIEIVKKKTINLSDELLLKYMASETLSEFRKSGNTLLSVTLNGRK